MVHSNSRLKYVIGLQATSKTEGLVEISIGEAKVKGNVAGEAVRSEPRNQTSFRSKFGAYGKGRLTG